MATVDQKDKLLPAYVAFGTFKNFIETLRASGIPDRIDKSVMANLAGGTQSHLTSTLKFLRLIGANGEPQESLDALREAVSSPDDWAAALGAVVTEAYQPVIGNISLKTATPAQLTEQFRGTGLEGATLDKALRFYLTALSEAKLERSTHIAGMKPRNTRPATAKPAKSASPRTPAGSQNPAAPPKPNTPTLEPGMIQFPIYFRGKPTGTIIVPDSISVDDCNMISLAVKMIEAYASQV